MTRKEKEGFDSETIRSAEKAHLVEGREVFAERIAGDETASPQKRDVFEAHLDRLHESPEDVAPEEDPGYANFSLDIILAYDTIDGNNTDKRGKEVKAMGAINMRDFPDDLHRALKVRAAETGTSIKALMIRYCQEGLEREKKSKKKGGAK